MLQLFAHGNNYYQQLCNPLEVDKCPIHGNTVDKWCFCLSSDVLITDPLRTSYFLYKIRLKSHWNVINYSLSLTFSGLLLASAIWKIFISQQISPMQGMDRHIFTVKHNKKVYKYQLVSVQTLIFSVHLFIICNLNKGLPQVKHTDHGTEKLNFNTKK